MGSHVVLGLAICSVVRLTDVWAPTQRGRDCFPAGPATQPPNTARPEPQGIKPHPVFGVAGCVCWACVGIWPCNKTDSYSTKNIHIQPLFSNWKVNKLYELQDFYGFLYMSSFFFFLKRHKTCKFSQATSFPLFGILLSIVLLALVFLYLILK